MQFIGLHMRTHFSLKHIKHAAYFCRQAHEAEKADDDQPPVNPSLQMEANATGTLFSSTAFVEATINELFSKTADCLDKHLGDISQKNLTDLATLYEDVNTDRLPTLEKYKAFVDTSGFGPLDLGVNPAQDIKKIFTLRDSLVHYKGYWLDVSSENMVKDERSLMSSQLGKELQKKYGTGIRSDGWLCVDFAEWCVISSLAFVELVFDRFKGVPFHNHIRGELNTRE